MAGDLTGAVEGRSFAGDVGLIRDPGLGVAFPAACFCTAVDLTGSVDAGIVSAGFSVIGCGLIAGDLLRAEGEDEDGVSTFISVLAEATDLGGNSLLSFVSSFAGSLAICEETLELRGIEDTAEDDWRLFCCSKRPMRFATL